MVVHLTQPVPETSARILIAEDNPLNRSMLQALLESAGLSVETVDDGHQAVTAWSYATWDVIVMDIHMPGLDGFGAAREIRAREIANGGPRTPIIALTGDASTACQEACLAAGIDQISTKPIDLEGLLSAIDLALTQAMPLRRTA